MWQLWIWSHLQLELGVGFCITNRPLRGSTMVGFLGFTVQVPGTWNFELDTLKIYFLMSRTFKIKNFWKLKKGCFAFWPKRQFLYCGKNLLHSQVIAYCRNSVKGIKHLVEYKHVSQKMLLGKCFSAKIINLITRFSFLESVSWKSLKNSWFNT